MAEQSRREYFLCAASNNGNLSSGASGPNTIIEPLRHARILFFQARHRGVGFEDAHRIRGRLALVGIGRLALNRRTDDTRARLFRNPTHSAVVVDARFVVGNQSPERACDLCATGRVHRCDPRNGLTNGEAIPRFPFEPRENAFDLGVILDRGGGLHVLKILSDVRRSLSLERDGFHDVAQQRAADVRVSYPG